MKNTRSPLDVVAKFAAAKEEEISFGMPRSCDRYDPRMLIESLIVYSYVVQAHLFDRYGQTRDSFNAGFMEISRAENGQVPHHTF